MIYMLYGQPGSGKTTLAKLLADHLDTPFVIDGDEFRGMFKNVDYGFGGRKKNIRAANAVATYLNKKATEGGWACVYLRDGENSMKGMKVSDETDVVISLVNPYKQFREEVKEDNKGEVFEILLKSNRDLRKNYHVENFEEGDPDCIINTNPEVKEVWDVLETIVDDETKRRRVNKWS